MDKVKLIVQLTDMEPLVYSFNSVDAAKVADRFIQRQWNNEYVDSKLVYDEGGTKKRTEVS